MAGQFGTGAELSYSQFGTPEMCWVQTVRDPKCLYINDITGFCYVMT